MRKQLVIVCEEKFRTYADYLSQLISLEDDDNDSIVGIKDGAVQALIWTEKDYKANAATISSDQYILFIGQGKLIKEKSAHMETIFSEYGMKYGWLGKQAFLSVEKTVSFKDYDNFFEYAKKYQTNIEKIIEKKKKLKDISTPAKVALGAVTPYAALLAVKIATPLVAVAAVVKSKYDKKIRNQQYSCVVLKFYLDDLGKFLKL